MANMKKQPIEHFIEMRKHMSHVLHKSVFLVNTIIINIEVYSSVSSIY